MLIINGINIEKNKALKNAKTKKETIKTQPDGFQNAERLSPEKTINSKVFNFKNITFEN